MSDKYLISATVNGVDNFYTADASGTITSIGTAMDWSRGFDSIILSKIDNSTYSTLDNCKVWVNNTSVTSATEETTGEGLLWTRRETAVSTAGYSGVTKVVATGSSTNKYAVSFYGNETFMTRGTGTLASSTAAIPTTAAARTTAGVTIDTGTDNAFDGDSTTDYTASSTTDSYVGVTFTTAIKTRKHSLYLSTKCRKPCTVEFQVYNDATSAWVVLDTIIIRAAKLVERNFDNSITSTKYRWHFSFDATAFGDDPTKDLVVTNLNTYSETTGTTWITCSKADVKTKGMDATTLSNLTATDYASIFAQNQMDIITYLPAGNTLTNIVVTLPTNSAPQITDFVTNMEKVHQQDIIVQFTGTDPEGSVCTYKIKVNGTLVIPETEISSSDGKVSATILNKYLTIADGLNEIEVIVTDELGAETDNKYYVTKVDKMPGYSGVLIDNTYSFSVIDDEDKDQVKFVASLNGKQIDQNDLADTPYMHMITMSSDDIKIGQMNTLSIVLTDSVGGTTTVTEQFVGEYYGLIFEDTSNTYLSTDIGKVLQKVKFGPMVTGQVSPAVEINVLNKTSYSLTGLTINGPKDLDGYDTAVVENGKTIGYKHTDGTIWVELSKDDSFADTASFNTLSLPNLASKEKTSFFMRVNSKDLSATGGSLDFDTKGTASYSK